jgi:hypothetical protein
MPDVGEGVTPPLHRPWDPDDSLDFHAARLLILLRTCGQGSRSAIEGRTKLAKLDFFVRYPSFLQTALEDAAARGGDALPWRAPAAEIEAPMVRYRYGPWDFRYRQFLAFLEARKLIHVSLTRPERVSLTAAGKKVAGDLAQLPSFASIVDRCEAMQETLALRSGTELKDLVYELFPTEVSDLPLGTEI